MTINTRPIIFSAPMVLALLEGRKVQTRRLLQADVPDKPERTNLVDPRCQNLRAQPYLDGYCSQQRTARNPRGMGPYWCWWTRDHRACKQFKVGYVPGDILWVKEGHVMESAAELRVRYTATDDKISAPFKRRPSIHMPRWASRITTEVIDVRVEKLIDISDHDARAEGAQSVEDFRRLWDEIHGADAWLQNPWVVALVLSVHRQNVDHYLQRLKEAA